VAVGTGEHAAILMMHAAEAQGVADSSNARRASLANLR
jgi:hypothetical protein